MLKVSIVLLTKKINAGVKNSLLIQFFFYKIFIFISFKIVFKRVLYINKNLDDAIFKTVYIFAKK